MIKYNYKTIPDLLLDEEWQTKANSIETNFKNLRNDIKDRNGVPAKGFRTRSKTKASNKFIIERRKK